MSKTATKEPTRGTIQRPATRVFVSPQEPNTKFLVWRGPAPKPGENELMREEAYAAFTAGICTTTDERTILWLEAHEALVPEEVHEQYHLGRDELPELCANRGICMDAENERVGFWADQVGRKLNLANRDAQLEKGYDVEAALRGENPLVNVASGDSILSRAQAAIGAADKAAGAIRTNSPERFHPQQEETAPEPESEGKE